MGTEVVNGEISCLKTDCCPKTITAWPRERNRLQISFSFEILAENFYIDDQVYFVVGESSFAWWVGVKTEENYGESTIC